MRTDHQQTNYCYTLEVEARRFAGTNCESNSEIASISVNGKYFIYWKEKQPTCKPVYDLHFSEKWVLGAFGEYTQWLFVYDPVCVLSAHNI